MNASELKSAIREVEMFRDLSEAEHDQLASYAESRLLKAGDYLYQTGQPREALYVIADGEIELVQTDPVDGERRMVVYGAHDLLGEGALVDESPHSTSARAVSDTRIVLVDHTRFPDILQKSPDLAVRVLARLVRGMSRKMISAVAPGTTGQAAEYMSGEMRREHDLLGDRDVPKEAYYGVQTLRGMENYHITGVPISQYPELLEGLAMIKMGAAKANAELGLIPQDVADAIVQAGQDILQGKLHNQFVLDPIQGGAGTSTNMNANEVMANRALEILGYEKGDYKHCHPNNHVNFSQSTNDAYPSALHIATIRANEKLLVGLRELIDAMRAKSEEFRSIIKMGRTQLQDAVPMTLGQEFEASADTLTEEIERLRENANLFLAVNMGATAIGTGINADPEYSARVIPHLREISGLEIKLAPNLIEATRDTGAFVMYSSALKRLAVKLSKICNDLRLLASGPRCGFNEINLPAMAPGSSIMPGKVNPVIPEVVNQVAFKVIGNDLTVTLAAEAGQLELNVMEPVIAQSIFESIEMLKNAVRTLTHRCIKGITANEDVCKGYVYNSIGLVTALNPVLGYEVSTELAKEALINNRGIYELVLEKKLLSQEDLDKLLDPANMIKPHHLEPRG